ncbi:MAG: hypothetical protein L6R40_007534 [Gallowayella cf. fulva]|nr:MAG: hypothetical protein L6R40_007534 [Xanthomendoza cf. fulva]
MELLSEGDCSDSALFNLRYFHTKHHAMRARIKYDSLEQCHYADWEAGRCPAYLEPLLSMSNLRKVLFINGVFDPHLSSYGGCGSLNCTHRVPPNYSFADTPAPAILHFRLLMIALIQKEIPITQLVFRNNDGWRFVFYYDVFEVSHSRLEQMQDAFRNLTKLHLDLEKDSAYNVTRRDGDTNLAQVLRQATSLEYISIDVRGEFYTMGTWYNFLEFEGIFHGCVFGKLKSYLLNRVSCQAFKLLSFVRGCRKLEEFCIESCDLESGCWSEVVDETKKTLPLLSEVQLAQLWGCWGLDDPNDTLGDVYNCYGEVNGKAKIMGDDADGNEGDIEDLDEDEEAWVTYTIYGNKYGSVQDFFFHGGPNPFGAKGRAVERAKFAANAKQVAIPGCLERMQKNYGYVEENRRA